ncbi:MAG: mRNA surveillance protein pelota [Promethearchaeota archaeon]
MKIIEINEKTNEITVKPENLNDLWTLYNVITENDIVSARTSRRVVIKEGTKGDRKPMWLKLKVKSVSFHEFSNRLRIKGTILEGPEDFVSFGSYHTFNIETGQQVTIQKSEWLKNELKRLTEASKFETNFIMIIIAIETGVATISLMSNYSHERIATIKKNIPGKRYEQAYRNKAYEEFFDEVLRVVVENIKNLKIDLIIVCGPGNIRDRFINHFKDKVRLSDLPEIFSLHASSGTESAIFEVLKSKKLAQVKKNIRIIEEAQKIEKIFEYLANDTDMIAIGMNEIENAAEQGAVEELFLVDKLIRSSSKEDKLRLEKIISNVLKSNGNYNILSSDHPTGKQIEDLGAIVAILRYKIR